MVRLAIWTTAKVLVSRRDPSCKAHYYLIWGKFEHLFSVAMRNFLCVGRTDRGMLKKRSRLIPRNKGIINRVLHTLLFGDSRPISNDRATRGNRAIVLKEGEAEPTLLHPTRVFPPRPMFSPGGVPYNTVSPVSASTGVLATAADPCSNFTADNAAAKSSVKILTVASASAMLLVCQTMPTASAIAIFVLPTT